MKHKTHDRTGGEDGLQAMLADHDFSWGFVDDDGRTLSAARIGVLTVSVIWSCSGVSWRFEQRIANRIRACTRVFRRQTSGKRVRKNGERSACASPGQRQRAPHRAGCGRKGLRRTRAAERAFAGRAAKPASVGWRIVRFPGELRIVLHGHHGHAAAMLGISRRHTGENDESQRQEEPNDDRSPRSLGRVRAGRSQKMSVREHHGSCGRCSS